MVYSDIDIATQVKKNIELINRNIEYLQNLKEILDYIEKSKKPIFESPPE